MAFFSIFLLGIQFRIRIALRPDSTISSDNITTMTTFSVSFSLSVHFVASLSFSFILLPFYVFGDSGLISGLFSTSFIIWD